MATPTRSAVETLNNLYATTLALRAPELTDNIFERCVFWRKLKEMGNLDKEDGGRKIEEDVEYATNPTVKGVGRGGTIAGEDYQFMTTTEWEWKFIAGAATRYYTDLKRNRGKAALKKLINKTIDNLVKSIIAKIETDLFLDGTGDSGNTIPGLQHLIQDDPTNSEVVGGINQATYSWWRNKFKDMNNLNVSIHLRDEMTTMFNDCSLLDHGDDAFPSFLITDQATVETYDTEAFELRSIVNERAGDLGMSELAFKGMPLHWSPKSPSNRLYFINMRYFKMKVMDSGAIEFTKWKDIHNQLDHIMHAVFNGTPIVNCRACHGVMFNIENG